MKERITLTESELYGLVEDIVAEAMEEEGLWGKIKGGAKGVASAARGEYNKAKRGVFQKGLDNEYQGQNLRDRFRAAGNEIKDQMRLGDRAQDINNFIKDVKNATQKYNLTRNVKKAAEEFVTTLERSLRGSQMQVNRQIKERYN